MSEPTQTPAPQPDAGSDVTRSLAALADAMTSLAKSQQTVLDALRPPTPQAQPRQMITGEFSGGSAPGAAVDFSKLTPLQQITLGLRDAPTTPPPHWAD